MQPPPNVQAASVFDNKRNYENTYPTSLRNNQIMTLHSLPFSIKNKVGPTKFEGPFNVRTLEKKNFKGSLDLRRKAFRRGVKHFWANSWREVVLHGETNDQIMSKGWG